MKRRKRAYKYVKEELESQLITLKKVKIIDTVSEYATIDRIDGMLSLASEIGLMNNKKIKKLPELESSIKLTSHNMLRVLKILNYLVEKNIPLEIQIKTKQMKAAQDIVHDKIYKNYNLSEELRNVLSNLVFLKVLKQ